MINKRSQILQPIIIKKIKKQSHSAHGGAWKVAYADFVTAMMAFFLLLWLLNSSTEEMRTGLAEQFSPFGLSNSTSGSGDILKGRSMNESHAQSDAEMKEIKPFVFTGYEDSLLKTMSVRDRKIFKDGINKLLSAVKDSERRSQLHLKITEDGLLIQIIDKENRPLFPPGKSLLLRNAEEILYEILPVIKKINKKVKITGHTDTVPFIGQNEGTNWILSASRANNVRKFLEQNKIPTEIIFEVSGRADRDPLLPNDLNHPSNRRVDILLLKED